MRLCASSFPHTAAVKKTAEEKQPAAAEPFNYFNYFTEVEEEFVRRRGKPMFISPMDWALVESWKTAGIPLHVVLRAINEAFDVYDARQTRFRKVNSIFYCEQAVETMFAEYRLSQVGAAQESPQQSLARPHTDSRSATSAFSKETLIDFITFSDRELGAAEGRAVEANQLEVVSAINRARKRLGEIAREIEGAAQVCDEALEHDLDAIDRMLLKAVNFSMSEEQLREIRADAEAQLKVYKKKIDEKIYKKTVENFVSRRLREINLIPRLSLFYI